MPYTKYYVPQSYLDAMSVTHTLGVFLRLDTDPALHIWLGVSDVPASIDSVDAATGTVYMGGGKLMNIPVLEAVVNGQSSSVEIGLAGISAEDAAPVILNMPNVRGKALHIGIAPLDQYYQPIGPIIPLWYATGSHTTDSMPVIQEGEDRTVTLRLAAMSGANTRSRPSLSLWSSAHQKALYPGDKFCDQTARLATGVAPAWPAYS